MLICYRFVLSTLTAAMLLPLVDAEPKVMSSLAAGPHPVR
jgi:hypothetical protein